MNVMEQVERYSGEMIALRRRLHQHPELGMQERNTTRLIEEELLRYGVEIEDKGLESGVSAIIRGKLPGRTVALRADIDALPVQEETGLPFASLVPGVSHACGHDIHTAAILLCARILSGCRELLAGNVRLLFQPAEELATGAKMMIGHGVMEDPAPDVILGLHVGADVPLGKIGLIKGPANAAFDGINITVKGVGGHGAHRYKCVDPITAAAFLLTQLHTLITCEVPAVEAAVLSFGSFHAGAAANVVPPEAVMRGTLRTFHQETRDRLKAAIVRMAENTCRGMKAEAVVEIEEGLPPLLHDPDTVDLVAAAAEAVLGGDGVAAIAVPSSGSDDFSAFLAHCPGVRFRLGTADPGVPASLLGNHNPRTVFGEEAILAGAAVCCRFVLDYLRPGQGGGAADEPKQSAGRKPWQSM